MNLDFIDDFGKAFIPKVFRPNIRLFFLKAGFREVPYRLFGMLFLASVFITYGIYFRWIYPWVYSNTGWILFLVLTFIYWVAVQLAIIALIILVVYEWVDIRIYNRTRRIEEILPEFLRYVSENLKGGMSFDRALWGAIRPQFGVLADEIRLVAKKTMSGDDMEEAMMEFSQKYNSMMVTRTINLIVESMRSGGKIANIIDRIEDNIRETRELRDEMNATNLNYFIFLSFIVVAIAPLLFALSYNLLVVLKTLTGKVGMAMQRGVSLPLNLGQLTVKPEGFATFSIWALVVISLFVSLIISVLRKGNMKAGVRYIPLYCGAAIGAYYIFRFGLDIIFKAAFVS